MERTTFLMIYPTVFKILRLSRSGSAFQLILAQTIVSRPRLKKFLMPLLRLFTRQGHFLAEFRAAGQSWVRASFRLSDLASDLESFREVGMGDDYGIAKMNFEPELIVDGGGNIGFFTLAASRRWPRAEFLIFEPLPENLSAIKENLKLNNLSARIMPLGLGNSRREAVFYRRTAANQGGLLPQAPYLATLKIRLAPLSEFVSPDKKCLIKLDIEGVEMEVMAEFLKMSRPRAVIVGELHFCEENRPKLTAFLESVGWRVDFSRTNPAVFRAAPHELKL